MKKCPNADCNQILGETITVCPACGYRLAPAQVNVDDYALLETIHETSAGILYRARRSGNDHDVMLRLYPAETDFSLEKAEQINRELLEVSALPGDCMVRHIDLQQSGKGRWYRVSEWVDTVSWGDLMASRFFRDPRNKTEWIGLFIQTSAALSVLHKCGRILPHLSLNDLLLYKDAGGNWKIKLDYKLSPIPKDLHQAPAEIQELKG